MRRLLFLLWICLSAVGCDDNVDIGLVAEQMQVLTTESAIQATLPAEVLAAMKLRSERMDKTLETILEFDPDKVGFPTGATDEQIRNIIAFRLNLKESVIEKGIHEMDFHAMQKAFYTQYIDAGGIAVVANEKVEDVFLYAARDAIHVMTSKHPELRDRLLSKHGRFYMVLVLEKDDFYDVPELQLNTAIIFEGNDEYYIWWAGACNSNSGATADTITGYCFATVFHGPAFYGTPCPAISTFIHEFAHILEWEIEYHQSGFRDRLQAAYDQMRFTDEQRANYHMASAPHEYFAKGSEWWFRGGSWREKLIEEHPMLAELMAEWYPDVDCIQDMEAAGLSGFIYNSVSWKIIENE